MSHEVSDAIEGERHPTALRGAKFRPRTGHARMADRTVISEKKIVTAFEGMFFSGDLESNGARKSLSLTAAIF